MATEKGKKDPGTSPSQAKPSAGGKGGGTTGGGAGADYPDDNIRLGGAGAALFTKAVTIGGAGLALSVVLGMMENDGYRRFSFSYLSAFMWVLAIGLGALFWVTLQNLVNAHWSLVMRRIGEVLAANALLLAVLALPIALPIFMGHSPIYLWTDHDKVHESHALHHKSPYLNSTFFLVRFIIYFGFWTWLSGFFLKNSLAQDQGGKPELVGKMRAAAGPAMMGFAVTMTFCSIDLMMSLDEIWFSTIFGIYYLASCVLGINSFLALTLMWLQKQGVLAKSVTTEHYHDLGKLMFAFTVFWAYIGFSQFMLIWYANIPEETLWFKVRFAGQWGTLSWILLFGHFVIPFFGLLSRHIKRKRQTLAFWAVWQLTMIYLDMYWLIMPNLGGEDLPFKLIDLTCVIGVLGIFVAGAAMRAKNLNLLAIKDPRLPKSLAFENL